MEFITVRDLRVHPGQVWDRLAQQQDIVVTSNGRPIALLTRISEDEVEETLIALRRARAQLAVSRMRTVAAQTNANRMTAEEIEAEIKETRQNRPR
ncbi:MAG TPA: type II toxin-antitoxin system prevent-host-death family antitoxin [Anaerolineae bacterium]|nr:type II toxin-antitoxin system prevent-host-death family antitoxin [Anaerolineae bacterium]